MFKPTSQCGHVTVSDEVSVLVLMKFRHQGAARLVTPAQVQFAQILSQSQVQVQEKYTDTRSSLQKLLSFRNQKNQTEWQIETWILKQEMETDDDHATMRESFSLVQNILFIDYFDVLPAH